MTLVLTRKVAERIVVSLLDGRKILIDVLSCQSGRVRLGVDAPQDIRVDREEVAARRNRTA